MLEDEDLRAVFFDLDDFARVVTVKPNGADPYTISAIFDARPVDARALSGAQVGFKGGMQNTGNSPQIRCRTSDVADVKQGRAVVVVDGTEYNVWDVMPDGTGLSTLILKRA